MINPALLKALIPQDVMDNVQNAAQAFIEMRNDINELKVMVTELHDQYFGEKRNAIGLSPDNGNGTE